MMMPVNVGGKRRSIFLPWFSSYVAILIVPIFVSSLIYGMSGRMIEDEITRANSSTIKQLQEVTDGYLKSIEKISMEIGLNANILGLLNLWDKPNQYHQYRMVEIIRDLKIYKASNPFIDDLYVYSDKNDFALSYTGRYDSRLLYEFYYQNPEVDYDEWLQRIQKRYMKTYISMPRKTPTGELSNSLAFMQSLPIEHTADAPAGTLAVMMDMDQVAKLLQNSKWANLGTLLIIDEYNTVIASTGPADALPSAVRYADLSQLSGNIRGKWAKEDVVISYVGSAAANWKYVSIIPSKVFYSKAKFVRNVTVISTLLCLIIGSIIAYAFTKRNYNPLKHIVEVILDKGKMGIDDNANEYSFIKDAVLRAIEQKDEAHQKLRSQNSVLRANFLLRLLKGNLENSIPVEEAITNYELQFHSAFFAVMLLVIEDCGIFEKDEANPQEGTKLARLVVGNVAEELGNQRNHIFIVEDDDIIACIVNFKPQYAEGYREELLRTAGEAQQFMKEQFGIQYTVSLSSLHQNYFGISQAYREAMEALEYRIVTGSGKIIAYDEIKEKARKANPYTYSLDVEQRFMNCIKAGDLNNARIIMHEVIHNSFHKSVMPIQMAKCLMFSMVNTMINAVNELRIICDKNFMQELNPVERLLECKTVEEIELQMFTILNRVAKNIEESNKRAGNELWKDVMAYIEKNHANSSLSVSMIAEHFYINPSYLTSYFKGKTGDGLLECINKTRINKAKQLLKATGMSLNDIAENIGYYGSRTFIRVFKKLEGITPGKYRELSDRYIRNGP